jgi:hypothetical protein
MRVPLFRNLEDVHAPNVERLGVDHALVLPETSMGSRYILLKVKGEVDREDSGAGEQGALQSLADSGFQPVRAKVTLVSSVGTAGIEVADELELPHMVPILVDKSA